MPHGLAATDGRGDDVGPVAAGRQSPAHLGERLDALERTLPRTRRLLLHGQGPNAERRAPQRLADAIAEFAGELGNR